MNLQEAMTVNPRDMGLPTLAEAVGTLEAALAEIEAAHRRVVDEQIPELRALHGDLMDEQRAIGGEVFGLIDRERGWMGGIEILQQSGEAWKQSPLLQQHEAAASEAQKVALEVQRAELHRDEMSRLMSMLRSRLHVVREYADQRRAESDARWATAETSGRKRPPRLLARLGLA